MIHNNSLNMGNYCPELLEEIQYCNLNFVFQSVLKLFCTSPGINTIKKCSIVLCTNYFIKIP